MSEQWYLRREDGTVYGPVSLPELKSWAKKSLVGPNDDVSQDQETWQAAPMLKDLEMVWSVQVDEDLIFGPFNIYALIELAEENHLSYSTDTVHLQTGKHYSLGDVLLPLLFTERESLVERTQQELGQEVSEARAAAESLRHELNAREEDLKNVTVQFQNKVQEQTQLAEKAMEAHQSLLLEREEAREELQALQEDVHTVLSQVKEKDSANNPLETEVQELKAELNRRDDQIQELEASLAAASQEKPQEPDAPQALQPMPVAAAQTPAGGDSLEAIDKLKDELANARAAIHHRDVEITRLKNAVEGRPTSLVSQALAKNREAEEDVESAETGPQPPMALQTALSGIRRETLKDSKKKSQAAANYKRQRTAAKQEASSRKAAKGSSTPSRRK